MFSLFKKEVKGFLSSVIGYVVIIVFLLIVSLFLWVFPGEFNVLENGYSSLDGLFMIAPWVYLFLIPAITMRSFADEKRSGTIELLLTKPLTDLNIIMAKYLAGIVLVIFSIAPTLIYYYAVYQLGNPVGNIDIGATNGSYIGLIFLASAFVSIGIFASSITDNQVISFIISLFLCFIAYQGFDSFSSLQLFKGVDNIIAGLGVSQHYVSMSRGVIDTRDIIYFVGLSAIFIMMTKTSLESRKW
jgi:ABC-2 type transport system permease protein